MTNGLTRGIPAQDLPENQDESVAYTVDEVTKAVFPFDPADFREKGTEAPEEEAPKPKRGRPKKTAATVEPGGGQVKATDPDDEEAPGGDAEAEKAAAAGDATALREVGS